LDQHPQRQGIGNRNPRNHFRPFNLAPAGLGIGGNGYRREFTVPESIDGANPLIAELFEQA
jgi:hypothetical protein